jgi:hypothetical protein
LFCPHVVDSPPGTRKRSARSWLSKCSPCVLASSHFDKSSRWFLVPRGLPDGPRGEREESLEGPIRRTTEGGSKWELIKNLLEGDGNSNKMNTASNTRLRLTTQVGHAHVATGVRLDLGTNTQPSDPRTQRNSKPRVYRPTPVRPVSTTGQTGPCW